MLPSVCLLRSPCAQIPLDLWGDEGDSMVQTEVSLHWRLRLQRGVLKAPEYVGHLPLHCDSLNVIHSRC